MRVLVPESLSEEGLDKLRTEAEVDARKLSRDEQLAEIGGFDALIVRSATKVDRELLEAGAGRLKVVGRAGGGPNNIGGGGARRLGILGATPPPPNVLSPAEHPMALLRAMPRHIP